MPSESLQDIYTKAEVIVRNAAAFIKDNYDQVSSEEIEEKGKNSLVSYVDREAEKILIAGLQQIWPEAGFITEEETIGQKLKDYTWIIDPLDGTTNFLNGLPLCSVSVALYDRENIILGIVHEVVSGEHFHAIRGQGAFLNGQKIRVTDKVSFHDVLVGTGFPYKTEQTSAAHMTVLEKVLRRTRGIRRLGSAAIDCCYVACGRFGSFYENTLNAYDIAAGALIVQEAGGTISDFKGGKEWLFPGEILATAPQFKSEMLEILQDFYPIKSHE